MLYTSKYIKAEIRTTFFYILSAKKNPTKKPQVLCNSFRQMYILYFLPFVASFFFSSIESKFREVEDQVKQHLTVDGKQNIWVGDHQQAVSHRTCLDMYTNIYCIHQAKNTHYTQTTNVPLTLKY